MADYIKRFQKLQVVSCLFSLVFHLFLGNFKRSSHL